MLKQSSHISERHVGNMIGRLCAVVTATRLDGVVLLGIADARADGAPSNKSIVHVVFWGALALAITALIGGTVGAPL